MSESEHWPAYEEHSKTLRTWFVAYGIGAPVLFLSNDALWKRLIDSGSGPGVTKLFLFGVGIQVGLAALNKWLMWILYFGESHESFTQSLRYRVADRVSQWFWIDLMADVVTGVVFLIATQRIARAVLS